MKKLLLLFSVILMGLTVISCSSDDNNDNNPTEAINYAGDWSGVYNGDNDFGSWDITIKNDGSVTGSVYSLIYKESYVLSGTVNSKGEINSTFGGTDVGGSFNGNLSVDGSAEGTWVNNTIVPAINGTWAGAKSK